MSVSVRTRITLLAGAVTFAVCLLISVGLYIGLRVALYRGIDAFVEGEVREFGVLLTPDAEVDLARVEKEIRAQLGSRRGTDLVFRLLDSSGRLLITSNPRDDFPPPRELLATTQNAYGEVWFETIPSADHKSSFRFCNERARLTDGREVIIQAAYTLSEVDRSLAVCRVICISGLLLATGLSLLGGSIVARRSMRPVVAITEAARSISANRLSARVPRSGANDELDRLANTLNEMLQRVENSFEQIRQFTADAAHELRTPLTALRGSAEFALTQHRSEEQLRSVIEQSLEYYRVLSRVTDDLLLLARLDAGQEPLRLDRFSIPKLIEDVVDLYRPFAADEGVKITVHPHEDLIVRADSGKIRRLFNNLLDNSIKYMQGSGIVDVTIQSDNGHVTVAVADSGPGIPPEDLPHVFERFYRVDRARTSSADTDARSVGLGLAICRSIAHAHQGDISIESKQGVGTRVLLTIPRVVPEVPLNEL